VCVCVCVLGGKEKCAHIFLRTNLEIQEERVRRSHVGT